jgi:uncharacterized cupredoxin-like copper-binding protein
MAMAMTPGSGSLRVIGVGLVLAAAVVLGAGSAFAAGWFDGSGRDPAVSTVVIRIHYSAFDLGAIDVEPGQTIRFVIENTDPIDHEFIVGDEGVQLVHERGTEAHHAPRPGEVSVPAGETVATTMTFPTAPQTLIFGCHLPGHYAYGMHGDIRVA